MAINFGAPPRQESQWVKSTEERQADLDARQREYAAEASRIAAARAAVQSPTDYGVSQASSFANSGALDSFFAQQATFNPAWNTPEQQNWYKAEYAKDVGPTLQYGGAGDAASSAFIASNPTLQTTGYSPNSIYASLDAEERAAADVFANHKADFEAFNANETRQQQAYNQQSGGGFAGGIIDESYSDPFSSQISGQRSVGGLGGLGGMPTDPSMPNVAMPWQQPWGTPGFGQPGQGNSQGVGGYNPTGQQQGNQQGSQWGGVFGAKNPWSPA